MSKNFAVIGGDLRIVKLAKMLAEDENKIYTYGLEKAEELKNNENIFVCNKLKEALNEKVEVVISSIPFSKNGININAPFSKEKILIKDLIDNLNGKLLIAGSISQEIYNMEKDKYIKIIDIMKREELAVLNTIATAEGTIELAIANTNKILHGSKVLILGFGRVGKILARKMDGLSVNVTCAAKKAEDLAWIKSYGYKTIDIDNIGENLSKYDIIINTVPHMILTKEKIKFVKKDCLLIDLASKPGGIDMEEASKRNLKAIWALALPRKSSSSYICRNNKRYYV